MPNKLTLDGHQEKEFDNYTGMPCQTHTEYVANKNLTISNAWNPNQTLCAQQKEQGDSNV